MIHTKHLDYQQKYRCPVVVLSDGVLGQMIEPLKYPDVAIEPVKDESWAVSGNAQTRKNMVSSIFLDFNELEELNNRLQAKYRVIEDTEVEYEGYMLDDAETVLVAYGITSRICRSAVDEARRLGKKVGLFRLKTLFPFPKKELNQLAESVGRFIAVEMSNGQMRDDVKLAIDCKRPVDLVSRPRR